MGVIRVSEATERFLYENSRMGDTFDTILRRLHKEIASYDKPAEQLGDAPLPAEVATQPRKRAKRGTVAPSGMFRPYILRVLIHAPGHRLHMQDVIREVEKLARPKLTALDYEKLASGGEIRWQNKAQWDRNTMVQEGLLEPPTVSGRGVWMLSPKGVAEAKRLK